MTLKITHKHGTTAGTPPAAGDIDVGEIAINAADAEIYTKDTSGNVRKFQNTTTGTAAGVQFTQSGTGAVLRTVESKLQDVVSVEDFGAVPNDASAAAANTAAFYKAASTHKNVFVPAGTFYVNQIDLTDFSTITGNGDVTFFGEGRRSLIERVSAGATFYTSTKSVTLKLSDLGLAGNGNGTTVHYDYTTNPGGIPDTARQVFNNLNVRNDIDFLRVEPLAVDWLVKDCDIRGLSGTGLTFNNGAWACTFARNYIQNCAHGFYTTGGHATNFQDCIFEDTTGWAVRLRANTQTITTIGFNSCFFEQVSTVDAGPVVDIATTGTTRIRNVNFNGCFFTVKANETCAVQVTEGGGGTIQNISVSDCSFNQITPTVSDTSRLLFYNCYRTDGADTALLPNNQVIFGVDSEYKGVAALTATSTKGGNLVAENAFINTGSFSQSARIGNTLRNAFAIASPLGSYNVGSGNSFSFNLPESILDTNNNSYPMRTYLVSACTESGESGASSYTWIINMWGTDVANILVTELAVKALGTNPVLTPTRDPNGKLVISASNNNGRVMNCTAVLLSRN